MFSVLIAAVLLQSPVDYPIVAVRAPRYGDTTRTSWQEVFDPINCEAGTDIVIVNLSGDDELLAAGGPGACVDPVLSIDGKLLYFARISSLSNVNDQRRNGNKLTRGGSDIYVMDMTTREVTRLTNQEWTPNTGVGDWTLPDPLNRQNAAGDYLDYGIYNLGPCPLPNGRIMFTSSRNGFLAPKGFSFPNLQLFVMDADGKNVEQIGHLNIGSALHPTLLMNGEVAFASWESQGWRDERLWGLWSIWPDGRQWGPLISSFIPMTALHFQTQLTDGRIVVEAYYNLNNAGFGTLLAFNQFPPPSLAAAPRFGSPNPALNAPINMVNTDGILHDYRYAFSPSGLNVLTKFANFFDKPSWFDSSGVRFGKVTNPSGAPNNDMLLVWSPGAANDLAPHVPPTFQGEIALLKNGTAITHPSGLQILKADSRYNYQQPRALVPWATIYGKAPVVLPDFKNDGTANAALPKGTPFGLVGTSGFYKRDSAGFPTQEQPQMNWVFQGSDAGSYNNSEIWSVRIVQTEPQSHFSYGPSRTNLAKSWRNGINERLRSLGEVQLRKTNQDGTPLLDVDGNPDTSFLAKIPADVPFTFQMLDREGMTLTMAQTWHQVRPGETRNDCGGCHAHSQIGTDFATTAAAKPGYTISELLQSAKSVEFTRDVKPIIDAKCATCHDSNNQSGLNLQDGDPYTALLSKLIVLRSRESKLAWKIYGRVLDGSGSPLSGARMPLNAPELTDAEKHTITSWIDLGAANGPGVFLDDLRPTLTIQSPPIKSAIPASEIRIGAFDSESGLDKSSLSVKTSFAVASRAANEELVDLFTESNWVWTLATGLPTSGEVTVSVKDLQGNVNKVVRSFSEPTVTEDCEQLKQQVAELQIQMRDLAARVSELQRKIVAAQDALR